MSTASLSAAFRGLLLCAAAARSFAGVASELASFLAPVASRTATGGDLGAPFPVAGPDDCATACLADDHCISFNLDTSQQLPTRLCGIKEECWAPNASSCPSTLSFSCVGGVFSGVDFASYGLPVVISPEPNCAFSKTPACDAPTSAAVFEAACLNKSQCSVDVELATFGGDDPCEGRVKFAAAILRGNCTNNPPPPSQPSCTLSGRSRIYALGVAPGVSYYQRLLPRNDSRISPAVPYVLDVPTGNVRLAGSGLLASSFATALEFLVNGSRGSVDDLLYPYRKRHNASSSPPGGIWAWDSFVPGSVASMILMGAGGALRWTAHEKLRGVLTELLDGIEAAADADGFAVGYTRAEQAGYDNGNNQNPSYVSSWFTHGMLEASVVDPRAITLARNWNTWWNNNTDLPLFFPQDGSDDHQGPLPNGYDPEHGTMSTSPFATGHLLYWLNQAGIGHSRMAMSAQGTQADVDFLTQLFQEDWWLAMLRDRNSSAIWARKWYPDNYEVCILEAYLDLYSLTANETHLDAV